MVRRNNANARLGKGWFSLGSDRLSTTGFTLIEVIVTLTVLGFILLIIFGAFRLGLSAWERGESIKEEYQKVRIITQLISQQIKSIVPYKIKTQKTEGNYLAFEGKAHSLKFVSALPIKAKQPEGFVYAIYEFKEGGSEGGRLILYEQRVLNRDFFEEEPREELAVSLLEGISNVRFEYYQEEDQVKNRKEGWVEEWNAKEEKGLPKAFRMTITHPAYRQAGKNGKTKGENSSFTVLASIPSYRFEEVRTTPVIRRQMLERRP
jgi:general secretion pathway protein J